MAPPAILLLAASLAIAADDPGSAEVFAGIGAATAGRDNGTRDVRLAVGWVAGARVMHWFGAGWSRIGLGPELAMLGNYLDDGPGTAQLGGAGLALGWEPHPLAHLRLGILAMRPWSGVDAGEPTWRLDGTSTIGLQGAWSHITAAIGYRTDLLTGPGTPTTRTLMVSLGRRW